MQAPSSLRQPGKCGAQQSKCAIKPQGNNDTCLISPHTPPLSSNGCLLTLPLLSCFNFAGKAVQWCCESSFQEAAFMLRQGKDASAPSTHCPSSYPQRAAFLWNPRTCGFFLTAPAGPGAVACCFQLFAWNPSRWEVKTSLTLPA